MATTQSSSSSAFPQKTLLPFGRRAHEKQQQFILSRILPRETQSLQGALLDLELALERAHRALRAAENGGAA